MSQSPTSHTPVSSDVADNPGLNKPNEIRGSDGDVPRPELPTDAPRLAVSPADIRVENDTTKESTAQAPEDSRLSEPSSVASQVDEPSPFWLRRGDQLFVGVVVASIIALSVVNWIHLSGWGTQPVEIDRASSRQYEYKIDINSASWVEWAQLNRIGRTLARRIVEDREQNGPFANIDDLQRVKGIGPKTVEAIRPWLKVETLEDRQAPR